MGTNLQGAIKALQQMKRKISKDKDAQMRFQQLDKAFNEGHSQGVFKHEKEELFLFGEFAANFSSSIQVFCLHVCNHFEILRLPKDVQGYPKLPEVA